jgi:secretion/DNA translocation related TadE-like protein
VTRARGLGRCCRPGRTLEGDAGVATVLVVALSAVLLLLGAVMASLAAVAVTRHRAASAADLSALAAAAAVLEGPVAACGRAQDLAVRVGARVSSCTVEGDVVRVVAQVRPPGPLGRLGAASARARAGPVEDG